MGSSQPEDVISLSSLDPSSQGFTVGSITISGISEQTSWPSSRLSYNDSNKARLPHKLGAHSALQQQQQQHTHTNTRVRIVWIGEVVYYALYDDVYEFFNIFFIYTIYLYLVVCTLYVFL